MSKQVSISSRRSAARLGSFGARVALIRIGLASAVVVLGLTGFGSMARAEFFDFSVTGSLSNVSPAGSVIVGNGTSTITDTTPDGTVITIHGLTNVDPSFHENATAPGTDIVFANIAAATSPTTLFETVGFNFDFTMTLTDFASETRGGPPLGTGTLHIVGRLDGSVGNGRKVNLDQLTQYATVPGNGVVAVGSTMYGVTLNTYVPPGTTGSGEFGAHVTAPVPEPTSFALMCVGVVGLCGYQFLRSLSRRAAA